MDTTTNRLAEDSPRSSRVGGEFSRLRNDGSATADELREFIGQLRGRNPQEVLGIVAQSGLVKGMLLATIGFAVLMVAFTVIPYAMGKESDADKAVTVTQPTAPAADTKPNDSTTADPGAAAPATAATPTDSGSPSLKKQLGIDETKVADPKSNPLDKKLDNLLDGID